MDDTGFITKGTTSAGVARQYTGTTGKIDNCQIGVFAAYTSRRGRALIDRELYLPKSWTADPDRCAAAKIPATRAFATKPELARAMVTRILDAGMPVGWVAADEAFGQEWKFRRLCEERGLGYVAAVPKSQQITCPAGSWRIEALIDQAPDEVWQRLSCGDGAKGPRVYDWACAALPAIAEFDDGPAGRTRWVLARRSLSEPEEIAYYLAAGPADTPLAELVRIAGARWAIEECFQAAKNECGLDEYEVRRYVGWYRHVTLAMLAHAFLAVLAADAAKKGAPLPVNPAWRPSSWQRSGDSWRLSPCP